MSIKRVIVMSVLLHFQQYFSYIMGLVVHFIGGGNGGNQRIVGSHLQTLSYTVVSSTHFYGRNLICKGETIV